MKVEVETLSPVKRRLTIEVPQDEVAAQLELAYSGLGRNAQVRGFRPGRVPRAVLERQFGDRVRGEVFNKLIRESLADAVREQQIDIAGPPEVVTERAEPGAALRFAATVEVYPEIAVGDYSGYEIEQPVATITEADVERYLESLRESFAQVRPVEGRTTVQPGDVARIDYQGRSGDQVVTRGENRPCEVGRGSFPEAFEARLIGAVVGETLEFPVTFPADDRNPELAGKTIAFTVVIRGIAEKEVPPLDDEFAKDHGECSTLAELRERVRTQLEDAALRQSNERVRAAAIEKLVQAHELELPDSLVDRQAQQMMQEVAEGWRSRQIWPKDEQAAFAALREQVTPRAREQVKAALLLDGVAQREHVEINETDVTEEVERVAGAAGQGADRVRAFYAKDEMRQNLRDRLRRQRAVDLLVARARITRVEASDSLVAGAEESR